MKKVFLAVISMILCVTATLSATGCVSDDVTYLDTSESASAEPETLAIETQTEKQTEKKTEKKTEKPVNVKLKFASYNMKHAEDAGYDYSKIAKNITDNKIDIVGFQEVDNKTKRCSKKEQIKEIAQKAGYHYYKFFKAISHDGGEYGLGIVSKYPIESSRLIKLSSGTAEQRILAHAVINVSGVKVNFFVTHLSYDGEGGGSSRSKQFSELAAVLSRHDNFVLSGDFNTRNLEEYDVIKGSALVNTKADPQVTYPDGNSPLDNLVYSTATWKFEKINVVQKSYSDHYMIYAQATFINK